jgi:hypothetical protein
MREESSNRIIPIFTIQDLYVSKYGIGWNVYATPMYAVDNDTIDKTDISSIFNNSITNVLEYHKKHGISIDLFMKIEVMKDARYLLPDVEYEIDYDNMELITKSCNIDSTYRIIIHVNTQYINGLINDVFDLSREK